MIQMKKLWDFQVRCSQVCKFITETDKASHMKNISYPFNIQKKNSDPYRFMTDSSQVTRTGLIRDFET